MSHQPRTIYRQQPSSTGQIMVASTGCAWRDENIGVSTALATLKNHGFSVIRAGAAGVYTLANPVKGCIKDILVLSTYVVKIRLNTTTHKINNSTATRVFSVTNTTKWDHIGLGIRMVGLSTNSWYAQTVGPTSLKTIVTLTSST